MHLKKLYVCCVVVKYVRDQCLHKTIFHSIHLDVAGIYDNYHTIVSVEAYKFCSFHFLSLSLTQFWRLN
jgi:hypothetical protein